MTIAASTVIQQVADLLQELAAPYVHWKVDEMVRWLNAGQRQIVQQRPDANLKVVTATCVAGTRQDLTAITLSPTASVFKLVDVVRNKAGSGKAVRQVARDMLDAVLPTWHSGTGNINTQNWMYDPRDPAVIYVYPPALTTTQLECIVSAYPTDVTVPAPSGDYTSVSGNISVRDVYVNALVDYIIFRAYTKDAEFAANIGRAAAHWTAFTDSLASEVKGTAQDSPVAPATPNI